MSRIVFSFFVLGALVLSCGDEAPFNPYGDQPMPIHVGQGLCPNKTMPEGEISPGDIGPILFYIRQGELLRTNPPAREICLTQQTEHHYNCANFCIVEDIDLNNGLIVIRHLGIDNPELCLTAFGPAMATDGFQLPLGQYKLRFIKGTMVDEWEIESTIEAVIVNPDGEHNYTEYIPEKVGTSGY